MDYMKHLLAVQLGNNWIDRSPRGRGNRAARRAIETNLGRAHLEFENEPIYTDRPEILKRGSLLLLVDKHPSLVGRINE